MIILEIVGGLLDRLTVWFVENRIFCFFFIIYEYLVLWISRYQSFNELLCVNHDCWYLVE